MALIDKYFSEQNTRKTITLCNDTILVGSIQYTESALVEAIEVLSDELITYAQNRRMLTSQEHSAIVSKLAELKNAATKHGIKIGSDFRTNH